MQRRELLKRLGVLPLASLSGQLLAAPGAPAKLLLVFYVAAMTRPVS